MILRVCSSERWCLSAVRVYFCMVERGLLGFCGDGACAGGDTRVPSWSKKVMRSYQRRVFLGKRW